MRTLTVNRAYSLLEIKSVDEERRTIEGIASTPTPDRMNDIVELDGISFKLPMPFLYQHNARQPIGKVISAKVTKAGLLIKAQLARPGVAAFIDEAWALVKEGLVPGLSIGFRAIEEAYNRETGGFHFIKTELFEISAVTIPANAEATIATVKSLDTALFAASGRSQSSVVRLTPTSTTPGVSGTTRKDAMKIQEQITQFSNRRAAADARATEIMEKAANEGRTLDDTEKQEQDGLLKEIDEIDDHIKRLRDQEKRALAKATPVNNQSIVNGQAGSETRGGGILTVRPSEPKGIGMARMAIAMVQAKGNPHYAAELARKHWPHAPEVELTIKAVIEAGDTTTSGWASQLVPAAQQMQNEFLDLLRPQTILGKLNLNRVPFNIAVPVLTAGGNFNWVGEANPKPVTKGTLDSVSLRWAKVAGIIVITKELARFSMPKAELLIRNMMIKDIKQFLDSRFISTNAAVANVSPAGILNGITPVTPSATTAAAAFVDLNNLLNNFTANNVDPSSIVLIMSATQAIAFSLMNTTLGVRQFPNISVKGGELAGFQVIVSEAVGTKIVALVPEDILLAEDDGITVDVSDQASVEMSDTPVLGDTSPITGATVKSFWQNNLIGLRAEQFITWQRGRTAAVEYINGNAYVPS